MAETNLSRLQQQRHASRSGIALLFTTMESTRASSSPARRKCIRFGALLRLLDEKINLLEDLDLKIQLAVNDDAMESEILNSTQHLNDLLKQRSSFNSYYDGLKPLLEVADDATPTTSAGSRDIHLFSPDLKPLSSPPNDTPTTPSSDETVAIIGPCNEPKLESSTLFHSSPSLVLDSTRGCVVESSSTLPNTSEDPISSGSSLPEVNLPSDEGYHHSSFPTALVSRTIDFSVTEHDKDLFSTHNFTTIPLPELPTKGAADSSPLLSGSKPISRFNGYDCHPTDLFYIDIGLKVRAHQVALIICPAAASSLNYHPAAFRFHPYRIPAIRPAKPPPWLRGT